MFKTTGKMRTPAIICISFMIFVMTAITCHAGEWSRKGKGEIFILGQQMNSDTTSGLGNTIKVDDTVAGGIGAGFNFNDHFNLNAAFYGSSTDLIVNGTTFVDTNLFGMDLNLDCNILKTRFTPMITAGIGFINFSGEIGNTQFDETDFSYNAGIGFRWDITDHLLVKCLYTIKLTELEDSDDSINVGGVYVNIGYSF